MRDMGASQTHNCNISQKQENTSKDTGSWFLLHHLRSRNIMLIHISNHKTNNQKQAQNGFCPFLANPAPSKFPTISYQQKNHHTYNCDIFVQFLKLCCLPLIYPPPRAASHRQDYIFRIRNSNKQTFLGGVTTQQISPKHSMYGIFSYIFHTT